MQTDSVLPTIDGHLDIKAVRQELGLKQTELASLVGFSTRAIQSCEQGWRKPSPALEKTIILLLMTHRHGGQIPAARCWEATHCIPERCEACITYRTGQGHLCWFLHGTLCTEPRSQEWEAKRAICLKCGFFKTLLAAPADD
jgi:DNA-binding XRE family transcriptional regulator